jgi:transcriptional regulator with XRE-family HTH domain
MRREAKNMTKETVRIGRRLAAIRKKRGLSTRQLEQLTGILQPYIVYIEKGRCNATINTIYKIANELDVKIEFREKKPRDYKKRLAAARKAKNEAATLAPQQEEKEME